MSLEQSQLVAEHHQSYHHGGAKCHPRTFLHYSFQREFEISLATVDGAYPLSPGISVEGVGKNGASQEMNSEEDHETHEPIIPIEGYTD
jgi:hypothetical protein